MLSLGKIPPIAIQNPNPKFPSKSQFPFPIRLHLNVRKFQNGLHCAAFKPKKKGRFSAAEIDGPREFDDDFDGEIFDDGEFDDDDDVGVDIPLRNMKKWLENRPRGFGEGKVYDTSIEDKLMEEMEQSRIAQLANVNKLKEQTGSVIPVAKKETSRHYKGSANVQNGCRVRLTNLPKKKNIHRDLDRAFNGVPGILDIIPIVSGNEKTRDPVCKGFAFVDFKRPEDTHWFVQNFSGRSISFGRVEKQMQCEIMNTNLSNPASAQQSGNGTFHILPLRRLDLDEDSDAAAAAPETDVSLSDSWEKSYANKFDDADEGTFSIQLNDDDDDDANEDGEIIETSATILDGNLSEQELESRCESSSFAKKGGRKGKKAEARRRKDKSPISIISGSAKRLKMREKTVLTGVFSKYAANAGVKEQSR